MEKKNNSNKIIRLTLKLKKIKIHLKNKKRMKGSLIIFQNIPKLMLSLSKICLWDGFSITVIFLVMLLKRYQHRFLKLERLYQILLTCKIILKILRIKTITITTITLKKIGIQQYIQKSLKNMNSLIASLHKSQSRAIVLKQNSNT